MRSSKDFNEQFEGQRFLSNSTKKQPNKNSTERKKLENSAKKNSFASEISQKNFFNFQKNLTEKI